MARNRMSFFFRSNRGYGWSETYFTTAPTLTLALAAAKVLLPARVALMGRGSFCEYIRVSDDEIKRDSKVYVVPDSDSQQKVRSFGDADIANTCLLVRIEATDLKRRSLFLRGIPDDICLDNGQYTPTPAFTANFLVFATVLLSGAYTVKVRGDVAAPVDITNVSTSGPTGLVTITTAAAHGLALNDVVNIRGVLGATQVRGLQKVNSVIDGTSFNIRVPQIVKPYLGAGNVSKNSYSLVPITSAQPVRVSHHNAGRPFDSPRGRRRGK